MALISSSSQFLAGGQGRLSSCCLKSQGWKTRVSHKSRNVPGHLVQSIFRKFPPFFFYVSYDNVNDKDS